MTGGLQSSAYERDATPNSTPIAIDTPILLNDLVITKDMLNGDSGVLRIWWSFVTNGDYFITITKKGAADLMGFSLRVNGDNDSILHTSNYYRFDVGVKPGDLINLSSGTEITKVNDLQIQQIQLGA